MFGPVNFKEHVEVYLAQPSRLPEGFLDQLCDGKFTRPVNSNEEVQLAFNSLDLGDIDVEKPIG